MTSTIPALRHLEDKYATQCPVCGKYGPCDACAKIEAEQLRMGRIEFKSTSAREGNNGIQHMQVLRRLGESP